MIWLKKPGVVVFLIFLIILLIFFYPFFFKGLLPIPADITVGMYYPWLDYKWGYSTGVPIQNPLPSDIPSLLYPWRLLVIRAFKAKQWPLWNPGYFLGMPLLANFQSAALSLSNLFFVFLPESLAWSWGVISQSFLSLLLMYAYLRTKSLSRISCLLGAVIFSFSGFSVVWHQYNVHGWTMLFLPLILFLTDRYFETKEVYWNLLLSTAIAFQIFAGYLPLVIYSWLVVGLLLLWEKKVGKKGFWIWLGFACLGIGLSSIQLLPGLELIGLSIRKIDPLVEASQAGYLPLSNLITLVIPNFFGNPATKNYWGQAFYDNYAFWVGGIPLILAFLALFNRKIKPVAVFWWGIFLLGLVLAIKNPVGIFLSKALFLEGGVAARSLFLVDLSFAFLAAYGLEALVKSGKKDKKIVWALGAGILFLFLSGWLVLKEGVGIVEGRVAFRNSAIPLGALLVFGGGAGLALFFSKIKKYLAPLVLVLVLFSLWYPARKYWSFVPEKVIFPTTSVINFLVKQKKPFRFEPTNVIPQNMWLPYGLETVSGYDTLLPKKQGEFLSLVETGEVQKRISRVHLLNNFDSPLFPFLNVKYFLAKKVDEKGIFSSTGSPPPVFTDSRFRLVFEDGATQIYEDLQAGSRFWLLDGEGKIIKKNFSIKVKKYSFQEEVVEVDAPLDSTLVESASFYPGWQASLDSRKIEIKENDYALRTYLIPEGKHILKIYYYPESFAWGLKISLISLALVFLILIFKIKRTENK